MNEFFDIASKTYDQDFTNSSIGRLQRNLVWKYLDQRVQSEKPLDILELNCGTGEDALHLAQMGHNVTATDISGEMLTIARKKITSAGLKQRVHLEQLDLKEIHHFDKGTKFDLIFSNFGGLNCIAQPDLNNFKSEIRKMMKPNGALIMVIMPELCVWESLYFMLKLKTHEVFRRKKPSVLANVSGIKVETWYYSPKTIRNSFSPEFSISKVKPIGLFAPPSYMEPFMQRNRGLFGLLSFLERNLSRFSWQGSMSDHYYIELEVR